MTNAIKILKRLRVEYPKSPSAGSLVVRLDRNGNYARKNVCMCLLGAVGYAGGLDLEGMSYDHLNDENGIEEAIVYLARVIDPKGFEFTSSVVKKHQQREASAADYHRLIYQFNDNALRPTDATKYLSDRHRQYTPESIQLVVNKIDAAIALAESEAAPKRRNLFRVLIGRGK